MSPSSSRVRSEAVKWRQVEGEPMAWRREASGTESLLHFANLEPRHPWVVHARVLLRCEKEYDDERMKVRITRAWQRLFTDYAVCSTTFCSPSRDEASSSKSSGWLQGVSSAFSAKVGSSRALSAINYGLMNRRAQRNSEKEGLTLQYRSEASQQDLEQWTTDTLAFHCGQPLATTSGDENPDDANISTSFSEFAQSLMGQGIEPLSTGSLRLEVATLGPRHIALAMRFHHALFDGASIYIIIHEFLTRLQASTGEARQLDFPLGKPEPLPYFADRIPAWIYDDDYSSNVRSSMTQNNSSSADDIASKSAKNQQGKVRMATFSFSADETDALIKSAQEYSITVSQLAAAYLARPLRELLPTQVEDGHKYSFHAPINIRGSIGLDERCFGNLTLTVEQQTRTWHATQDAEIARASIIESARRNTDVLKMHKDNATWMLAAQDYMTDLFVRSGKRQLPDGGLIALSSDGRLERYLSSTFGGEEEADASIDIAHLSLLTNVQDASLQARTWTFGGTFTISFAFNERAWVASDVEKALQDWANALQSFASSEYREVEQVSYEATDDGKRLPQ